MRGKVGVSGRHAKQHKHIPRINLIPNNMYNVYTSIASADAYDSRRNRVKQKTSPPNTLEVRTDADCAVSPALQHSGAEAVTTSNSSSGEVFRTPRRRSLDVSGASMSVSNEANGGHVPFVQRPQYMTSRSSAPSSPHHHHHHVGRARPRVSRGRYVRLPLHLTSLCSASDSGLAAALGDEKADTQPVRSRPA